MSIRATDQRGRRVIAIAACVAAWSAVGVVCLVMGGCGALDFGCGAVERVSLAQLLPPEEAWQLGAGGANGNAAGAAKSAGSSADAGARWGCMVHRVRAGDTLYGLARAYYGDASEWRRVLDANRESAGLAVGTLVYLPTEPLRGAEGRLGRPGRRPDYYVVGRGDTLAEIAAVFLGNRSAYPALARHNGIANADAIEAGMMVALPGE